MSDYQVGDTLYHKFTTRAFASGVPTTLAGTPVVSIYEDDSVTQITAGITLTADFDSVTGLNHLTVVATGGNGFETGKYYQAVITTGTVGGVSVVGEVVWEFSLEASAAALDLANGTDGLGAIYSRLGAPAGASMSADIADLPTVSEFNARTLAAADYFDPAADTVANVTTVATLTGHTAQTGDSFARLGAPAGASVSADIAAIEAQTDDIGAAGAGLTAVPWNAAWDTEVESEVNDALVAFFTSSAQLVDNIWDEPTSGHVTAGTTAVALTDVLADTAEIGTAGAGLTDLGGMSTAMKAEVNAEADTALTDYDGPTNAEMEARTPTAAQLAYIVANAATGVPVTFTTAGGSTTAAVLNLVDGASASATNDQYNGRLLVFTNGTLKDVVTDITDYNGTTKVATITAIPTAPTASHTARLI